MQPLRPRARRKRSNSTEDSTAGVSPGRARRSRTLPSGLLAPGALQDADDLLQLPDDLIAFGKSGRFRC